MLAAAVVVVVALAALAVRGAAAGDGIVRHRHGADGDGGGFALPESHASAARHLDNGFRLAHVYAYQPHHARLGNRVHHYELPAAAATPRKRQVMATRRDRVLDCVLMCEQSYPAADRMVSDLPGLNVSGVAETARRMQLNAQNNRSLARLGWAPTADRFVGVGGARDVQSGVHALVYARGRERVVAFQGSYSPWDYYMDAVWYKDWAIAGQEDKAVRRWVALGNDPALLTLENAVEAYYLRATLNSAALLLRTQLASRLTAALPGAVAANSTQPIDFAREHYFGLAKLIVADVLARADADVELVLTGHSLGGALATLAAMWLDSTRSLRADTIVFGAPGTRCTVAQGRLADVAGLDASRSYPQVVAYNDQYDIVALFDEPLGRECFVRTTEALGVATCARSFALATTLLLQLTDGERTKTAFKECRFFTHSIYRYVELLYDDSVLLDDGSTLYGCTAARVPSCPSYALSGGFVLFILLHVLVPVLCCVLCCRCCVFFYRGKKSTGYWCGKCPCCRKPRKGYAGHAAVGDDAESDDDADDDHDGGGGDVALKEVRVPPVDLSADKEKDEDKDTAAAAAAAAAPSGGGSGAAEADDDADKAADAEAAAPKSPRKRVKTPRSPRRKKQSDAAAAAAEAATADSEQQQQAAVTTVDVAVEVID